MLFVEVNTMATTKKTESQTATKSATTRKPKKVKATFQGRQYDVLEQNEHHICLTDGTIHFWKRITDVEVG